MHAPHPQCVAEKDCWVMESPKRIIFARFIWILPCEKYVKFVRSQPPVLQARKRAWRQEDARSKYLSSILETLNVIIFTCKWKFLNYFHFLFPFSLFHFHFSIIFTFHFHFWIIFTLAELFSLLYYSDVDYFHFSFFIFTFHFHSWIIFTFHFHFHFLFSLLEIFSLSIIFTNFSLRISTAKVHLPGPTLTNNNN